MRRLEAVVEEESNMPIRVNLLEIPAFRRAYEEAQAEWRAEWRERDRAEGRAEGREQGRAEGREEGKREEAYNFLRRQLEDRFGPLPEWAEDKLRRAELTVLEKWSLRLLKFPNLEEVLA